MLGVTILGNNSAVPAFGRYPTCQILNLQDQLFLIDCGEGAQMQMSSYKVRKSHISRIFISHLHGDHYFGLIGLLNSMSLLSRIDPIHIYAPAPLQALLDLHCKISNSSFSFKIHFYPLTENTKIVDDKHIQVDCFKTKHSIECWGFLFKEKKIKRRIDKNNPLLNSIPMSFYERLQEGEDYINKDGAIIANDRITIAGHTSHSYAFCADTLYDEDLIKYIANVDLLYHEATYLDNMRDKAEARFHSTAKQAATIAQQAKAKRLIIGHFSSKYDKIDIFAEEARSVFPLTDLALEGVTYRINI